MKLTSEICFRAALYPGNVSQETLKNIAAYAYNKMAQEEQQQCKCGKILVVSPETNEKICPTLIS